MWRTPSPEAQTRPVTRVVGRRLRAAALLLAAAFVSNAAAHQKSSTPPVVLAPGYGKLDYAAPVAGSYHLPPVRAAADAPYVDSAGKRGRLHELYAGRVTLLAFIYTHCDDVNGCPLATFVMGQVAKRLAADARIAPHLRLVSFSFDPARDTPEVLARYAKSFRAPGASWDFVTSPDAESLATTLEAYQQSVQQDQGHAFAHVLRVFLVDARRQVRNIYSPAFLHADTLAADIQTVLMEQGDLAPGDAQHAPAAPVSAAANDASLGLPPAPTPAADAREVALGERLFFDRRLSLNGTLSCAMCHVPAQGYAVNDLATAVGIEGRTVKRNAPTLLNVGFLDTLFHDGRERSLETQAWSPLLAVNEMANPSIGHLLDKLAGLPGYADEFRAVYSAAPGMENVGRALAAYERSLTAGGSPFDRWYYGKEANALSARAQQGFALFRGKARCSACHTVGENAALFTDQKMHNTGLGYLVSMLPAGGRRASELAPGTTLEYDLAAVASSAEAPPNDLGRYEVTQDPADRWRYRTPSLRNVALTRPYMHNGGLSTLADVVEYYDRGGVPNEGLDPLISPLGLSADERGALVAFLESLTSPAVTALVERAQRVPVGNPEQTSP